MSVTSPGKGGFVKLLPCCCHAGLGPAQHRVPLQLAAADHHWRGSGVLSVLRGPLVVSLFVSGLLIDAQSSVARELEQGHY